MLTNLQGMTKQADSFWTSIEYRHKLNISLNSICLNFWHPEVVVDHRVQGSRRFASEPKPSLVSLKRKSLKTTFVFEGQASFRKKN